LVLRLGAPPTSQATARWLARHEPDLRLVDPDGGFADPAHGAGEILRVDPTRLCHALAERLEADGAAAPSAWLADFLAAERAAHAAIARGIEQAPAPFAPAALAALVRALPAGAALFAS